jgi:hypothetical protein
MTPLGLAPESLPETGVLEPLPVLLVVLLGVLPGLRSTEMSVSQEQCTDDKGYTDTDTGDLTSAWTKR